MHILGPMVLCRPLPASVTSTFTSHHFPPIIYIHFLLTPFPILPFPFAKSQAPLLDKLFHSFSPHPFVPFPSLRSHPPPLSMHLSLFLRDPSSPVQTSLEHSSHTLILLLLILSMTFTFGFLLKYLISSISNLMPSSSWPSKVLHLSALLFSVFIQFPPLSDLFKIGH